MVTRTWSAKGRTRHAITAQGWLELGALFLARFADDSVPHPPRASPVVLPMIPGGLIGLTVILVLFNLWHASVTLGVRRTLAFAAITAVTCWSFEEVGATTGLIYGAYHYTATLGPTLGSVPFVIPFAWFILLYPSTLLANRIAHGPSIGTPSGWMPILGLALLGAFAMTTLDLFLDPILSGPDFRAWVWEQRGRYFGVPIHNYVGWLVTAFVVSVLYRSLDRRWPPRSVASSPSR